MHTRQLSLVLLLAVATGLLLVIPTGISHVQGQAHGETIAIIGTGNVGSTLGKIWAEAGHTIIYGSRTPDSSRVRSLPLGRYTEASLMMAARAWPGHTVV